MVPSPSDADSSDADPVNPDPFGTARVRAATLQAWRSSPTRLAEDIAAETDLVTVGYRDRLLTELAANAADAAAVAEQPGALTIWLSGSELHVANTGAPLSVEGVRSLSALRVSAKSSDRDHRDQVGRFGVGFTATATVADRVELRSTTGSVVFDRAATAQAIVDAGVDLSSSMSSSAFPLLRLPWASGQPPADGFDTEVVLHLRDRPGQELLDSMLAQAPDLLLELSGLSRITVADNVVDAEWVERPELSGAGATISEIAVRITSAGGVQVRRWLQARRGATRWLVRLDGPAEDPDRNVLRAPTPTGVELSLPCRLIAGLPLTPDRRHLHPDADIASAAPGYVDLMRSVDLRRRLGLVPEPHRARNRDDARLVDAVLANLRAQAWLPGVDGDDLVPARSVVLPGLSDNLAAVLGELFGDLVHPAVSDPGQLPILRRLGVDELGLAAVAERLAGVERAPDWWHRLYAALAPLVATSREVEELAALPVPRSDGRMAIGVRGLYVSESITSGMRWLPTVDPVARHPLLERLGAQELTVAQALADPGLEQLVDAAADEPDGELAAGLADEVLTLLHADEDAKVPAGLAGLPLPDDAGDWRPADELLLPESPLGSVLVDDHPFGIVDSSMLDAYGADVLRRLGVGWGFMVISDDLPTAPDHELPDEELWWDGHDEPPAELHAVRDLDLVDPDRWPRALELLVADERIAPLLRDRDGYTAWWLRGNAEVDGLLLGDYRAPSDRTLQGVLDPLPHPHADELAGTLAARDPADAAAASLLLTRLADPDRRVSAGVAAGVHAAVIDACRHGRFSVDDVEIPSGARTLAETVSDDAMVVDQPWLLAVLADEEAVLAGRVIDSAAAEILADLLELPCASDELTTVVRDEGQAVTWDEAVAVRFGALRGDVSPSGQVRLHDALWVTVRRRDVERECRVSWWVDDRGVTHLQR